MRQWGVRDKLFTKNEGTQSEQTKGRGRKKKAEKDRSTQCGLAGRGRKGFA